jgi:8-oxo-dGTP diphosphatase
VAVDLAVFRWQEGAIRLLLIQRGREPFKGQWALPGGFVDMEETCAEAAARELEEETGLTNLGFQEMGVFDAPRRDPRGRTISVAYLAVVPAGHAAQARSGDDAASAEWFDVQSLPALAFDHAEVIAKVRSQLRQAALYRLGALEMLPEPFTAAALQAVHEAILGERVVVERLRGRLEEWGVLEEIGSRSGADAAATLFRVNRQRLEQLRQENAMAVLSEAKEGS